MEHQNEKPLEYSEIEAIIKEAFKPLRCGLKDDYWLKFDLRLHHGKDCIYRLENVGAPRGGAPQRL
jgi:hypothetical protein